MEPCSQIVNPFLHAAPHCLGLNPLLAALQSVLPWRICIMSRLLSCGMSSRLYHFCLPFLKPCLDKHVQFYQVTNIGYCFIPLSACFMDVQCLIQRGGAPQLRATLSVLKLYRRNKRISNSESFGILYTRNNAQTFT